MRSRLAPLAGALALCTALTAPFSATAFASTTPKTTPAPPSAVGLYPTVVKFSNTLRSGQYVDTIGVLNGTAHGQWFHFHLSGTAAPWLQVVASSQSTAPITEIWAPNGATPTTALLKLHVPATAGDGMYAGAVNVSTLPPKATKKGETTVGLSGQIEVTIAVTGTQIVAGTLVNAYTYPKIELGEPLRVFAVIKNASNITVAPQFHLQVTRVKSHSPVYKWVGTTGEALLPAQTSTYEVDWPAASTSTQTLGNYVAKISVTFPGGKKIGSWSLPFRLYPYGSLHRGGQLLALKLANKPRPGYLADIEASVRSTGEVQQETNFVGQLYRNGNLVQAVKSPVPILLQPGQHGQIIVPVPVAKNGLYSLSGTANFAGAQSGVATVTFRVGPAPLSLVYKIAIAAAVVVLAALIVALFLRRRRRRLTTPPRGHAPYRYTATHPRTLHLPPKSPVGSSPGRSMPRARRS